MAGAFGTNTEAVQFDCRQSVRSLEDCSDDYDLAKHYCGPFGSERDIAAGTISVAPRVVHVLATVEAVASHRKFPDPAAAADSPWKTTKRDSWATCRSFD